MFHCVQKCNLIFSPVEKYLNPQRSSRRPPSWIFIRNILIILPLWAEWMEWRSVHSGIGMRNKKTRVFYILAILIPELWIKNAPLVFARALLGNQARILGDWKPMFQIPHDLLVTRIFINRSVKHNFVVLSFAAYWSWVKVSVEMFISLFLRTFRF